MVAFGNRFVKGSEIQFRDIAHIAELFGDAVGEPIDLLLETPGGETDATEGIISFIQQTTKSFRVIIANAAKSNGTMISLAASSIIMGPTSELGPIEPSVGGIPVSTLLDDTVRTSNFGLHMAGHHALRQSRMLAKRVLSAGMMRGADAALVDKAVNALCTRDDYPSHGSTIDRDEAASLGLNIERMEIGEPLWDSIWLLYSMFDFDARRAGLAKMFEGAYRSLAVDAST